MTQGAPVSSSAVGPHTPRAWQGKGNAHPSSARIYPFRTGSVTMWRGKVEKSISWLNCKPQNWGGGGGRGEAQGIIFKSILLPPVILDLQEVAEISGEGSTHANISREGKEQDANTVTKSLFCFLPASHRKKAAMGVKILEKVHTLPTWKDLSHHFQNTREHARPFSWIFNR